MGDKENILDSCLEGEPAFCMVACPFHLDVGDFIEKMQRGSFDSAFKVYRDAVGFPGIVSELCHEPCKEVCPLRDDKGPIEIKLLEKSSINHTKSCKPNNYNVPAKDKRIVIIGAGISGLACALRLAAKRYEVIVYEQSDCIGGHLLGGLHQEYFLDDIQRQFQNVSYTLSLNTRIEGLDQLDYDAAYVATGAGGSSFGLLYEASTDLIGSNRDGIFLGGSIRGVGSIEAIAQGFHAANRIESYLKTGIMGGRIESWETKIPVNSLDTSFVDPLLPTDENFYNEIEAKAEAARCIRCACDSCKRYCDLIQYYNKNPKQIFDEVRATTGFNGIRGKITIATKLIASCNQCGLCKETCPQSIDIGELLLEGRRALHRNGALPWAYHDFFIRDMVSANLEVAQMARTPNEFTRSEFVFFPGCQMGASDPRYVIESYSFLRDHKPDTGLMLNCCGAPAVWAGDESLQKKVFEKIKANWFSLGKPTLIFACTTCRKMFREYLPEIKGVYIYDILFQWGVKPRRRMEGQMFSVFDPCTSRHELELQETIRMLSKEAGCRLEPLKNEGSLAQCCSFGGQVSIANPSYVKDMVKNRIEQNKNPYITYCTNCRDIFAVDEKPVLHILDIMFDLNDEMRIPPTLTKRQANREELKSAVLKKFWNERKLMDIKKSSIKILIGDKLKSKLNKEMILETDIIAVVEYCESSGNKVENSATGSFCGHMQVNRFTYWVEYRSVGDSFELLNAYSHRMRILTEGI